MWGQADPRGGFIGGSEPLRGGLCQGLESGKILEVGLRVCPCRAGHYFGSPCPRQGRVGEGQEVLGERKAAICPGLSGSGFLEGQLKSDRC